MNAYLESQDAPKKRALYTKVIQAQGISYGPLVWVVTFFTGSELCSLALRVVYTGLVMRLHGIRSRGHTMGTIGSTLGHD